MDQRTVKQIEAIINRQQAEINALKIILQVRIGRDLIHHQNALGEMNGWERNSLDAIDRFESTDGDAQGDETMKSTMQLFAHDFFEVLARALKS